MLNHFSKPRLISPLDSDLLLSFVLQKSREYILAHPEITLSQSQRKQFNKLEQKRLLGWPLAYLTGEKEFYGLRFKVNKNVLIPRPETETLVDLVEKINNHKKTLIADIGTGSGCIAVTLAKKQNSKTQKNKITPTTQIIATDISKKALTVARENACSNEVDKNIKFLHGNLLLPILNFLPHNNITAKPEKIIIVANLPYLTPLQIKQSPTIQKEPRLALVAEQDGLKYYRELLKQIKKYRALLPREIIVLGEIDPSQKTGIKKIVDSIDEIAGQARNDERERNDEGVRTIKTKIEFIKDLSKKIRFFIINLSL